MADKTFNLKVVGSLRDLKGLLDGSLTSFRIPDGVTSLDRDRFYNFANLIDLDFNQVEVIPAETCRGCTNLANVTFTTHTTEIGEYAFRDCTHFEDTELPHTLTNIGQYAFYNVGSYYSRGTHTFTMLDDEGVHTTIGDYAFCNSHLSTIRAYTNNINSCAFQECKSLTDVQLEIHGILGASAFYNCHYVENFNISPNSVITNLDGNVFYCLAMYTQAASRNIAPFDFRKSTFTTLYGGVWYQNYYDGTIYFPSTLTTINGNFLNNATGNWKLHFNSVPTVSSSSYLRSDTSNFTVKYFFPYELMEQASSATNWSSHTSQMIGCGSGFEAGATLPKYTRSTGFAITWYSDATLTTIITTSSSATDIYYCVFGSTRLVWFVDQPGLLDASIIISDGTNTYVAGDPVLVGTSVTVTPGATDPNKSVLFMLKVNGIDYTQTGVATVTMDQDLSVKCLYYDGINIPLLPNLADNGWDMIKLASQNNIVPTTWNVGDTKTLTYDGQTYTARLVDKTGKFTRTADGSTAYLYFELTELLTDGSIPYNATRDNSPANSTLLASMNSGAIWNKFDSDLRDILEDVNVKVASNGISGTLVELPFKIFLAREHDLFSTRNYSSTMEWNAIVEDEYYQSHTAATDRVKNTKSGSSDWYWMLSPVYENDYFQSFVYGYGSPGRDGCIYNRYVAPRFVL